MDTTLALLVERELPAAARGDQEAFGRLVDATRALVWSIVLAIVRDADLSRDVAQDVFLAAWRDLRGLRDPRSFLPWLRQLARHRAYHVLRTEPRLDARSAVRYGGAGRRALAAAVAPCRTIRARDASAPPAAGRWANHQFSLAFLRQE